MEEREAGVGMEAKERLGTDEVEEWTVDGDNEGGWVW